MSLFYIMYKMITDDNRGIFRLQAKGGGGKQNESIRARIGHSRPGVNTKSCQSRRISLKI